MGVLPHRLSVQVRPIGRELGAARLLLQAQFDAGHPRPPGRDRREQVPADETLPVSASRQEEVSGVSFMPL